MRILSNLANEFLRCFHEVNFISTFYKFPLEILQKVNQKFFTIQNERSEKSFLDFYKNNQDDDNICKIEQNPYDSHMHTFLAYLPFIRLLFFCFIIGIFLYRPRFMFSQKNERKNNVFFYDIKYDKTDDSKVSYIAFVNAYDPDNYQCLDFSKSNKHFDKKFDSALSFLHDILYEGKNTFFITYERKDKDDPKILKDILLHNFHEYFDIVHFIDIRQFHMIIKGNFKSLSKKSLFHLFFMNDTTNPKNILKVYRKIFSKQLLYLRKEFVDTHKMFLNSDENLFDCLQIIQPQDN